MGRSCVKHVDTKRLAGYELLKDFLFIIVGVLIAILISKSSLYINLTNFLGTSELASFISGIFFTSAFTIAPSAVVLSGIASTEPDILVALWGALGALFGDLIIFFFIRDRLFADIMVFVRPSIKRTLFKTFHLGFMKWLAPIVGALFIALPIPDELGLTLLGISRTKLILLIPISYVMNFIGILTLASII